MKRLRVLTVSDPARDGRPDGGGTVPLRQVAFRSLDSHDTVTNEGGQFATGNRPTQPRSQLMTAIMTEDPIEFPYSYE